MSWVYIHRMRWRIFAPLLPTAAACSLAAAVKSVQLAEEEKICSCQLRFMSGPDHCDCYVPALLAAPPRGWWRCRRRPHAYCSWHLGGKCVLTPQKTQQMQSKLENNVDSNHWIIVVAGCGGSVKLAAAGERMSSDNFWRRLLLVRWCCQQNCPSLSSFPNMDTVSLFLKKRKALLKKWRRNDLILYK